MPEIKKYRLRLRNEIVGFANKTPKGIVFKGRPLWFMQGEIKYDEIDEYTALIDINQREIYELDIVRYSISGEHARGVVLWNAFLACFGVYDINKRAFIPLFISDFCLFQYEQLQVVSYLFKQPELKRKIGLDNL